jgi:hypothetical protein
MVGTGTGLFRVLLAEPVGTGPVDGADPVGPRP